MKCVNLYPEFNVVENRRGSILGVLMLLGILASPVVNQWLHIIEDHHAETFCLADSFQFHLEEKECALTATFVSPYTHIEFSSFCAFEARELQQLPQVKEPSFQLKEEISFPLRGPPFLSTIS